MGLDITAYSYLRPVQNVEMEDGEPKDWMRYWRPGASLEWSEREFPGRGEGVDPSTIYETFGAFKFRAGSYSGYGEWRNWLAKVAGFKSSEDCWSRGKLGDPFFELIHFADNEGVIGPKVARKLATDFADHIIKAIDAKPAEHGQWYIDQYVRWWAACMTAAEGGAIDFH
jgi:hypothetical protein